MKIQLNIVIRDSPLGNIDVDYNVEAHSDEIVTVIETIADKYPQMMADAMEKLSQVKL